MPANIDSEAMSWDYIVISKITGIEFKGQVKTWTYDREYAKKLAIHDVIKINQGFKYFDLVPAVSYVSSQVAEGII